MGNRINRLALVLRSLFYTGNFNIENMQGTGFKWLVEYINKKTDKRVGKNVLEKEGEYFNTHPFFITFILGVWFREVNTEEGPDYWKKVYSSAFAAVGDSFFWYSYKVLCFVIAAIVGLYNPIIGVILYLLVFNGLHFYMLFQGYGIGYKYGKNLINWFNMFKINQWGQMADLMSVFLLGVLLSLLIKTNSFISYWHYFLATVLLLLGLFLGKVLNVVISFVITIFGFGFLLLFRGL
ncbi:MAG: PTS system mannose/fructose/sorbose family transporter subunit IID [Calditerrivibrio sp.]|nr:PTS system mannose/fructose/sorbose family transporter subunit IID [Calditerrivibrio sp.]